MGKEPVRHRRAADGYVTSAAFGYTIGRPIAYAWLPAQASTPGTALSVVSFGTPLRATVAADPHSTRRCGG